MSIPTLHHHRLPYLIKLIRINYIFLCASIIGMTARHLTLWVEYSTLLLFIMENTPSHCCYMRDFRSFLLSCTPKYLLCTLRLFLAFFSDLNWSLIFDIRLFFKLKNNHFLYSFFELIVIILKTTLNIISSALMHDYSMRLNS